ncbi:MAG: hypothetical protein IKY33_04835 [Clostridia bacterium]|nr:hypothetical protein [Clostridia bacterium]
MEKSSMGKIIGFACGLCAVSTAVVWSALYPTTGWETLLIIALGIGVQFVPLFRQAETLLALIAAGVGLAGGAELCANVFASISHSLWWIGLLLFVLLLCYVGRWPIYRSAFLLGLAVCVGFVASFVGGVWNFDGEMAVNGLSFSRVLSGTLVLWGGGAIARNLAQNVARTGTVVGCLLWGGTAFVPQMVWSREALQVLPLPLTTAWRTFGAEVWLTVLFALGALWLSAAGLLVTLQNVKTHSFTNKS